MYGEIKVMAKIHQFNKSLNKANDDQNLGIWESLYRAWFPDFEAMIAHPCDGWHQRAGIDRTIILSNSKTVTVDEKLREVDRSDVALEFISATSNGSLGWVCKSMACDYIAYAFRPTGKGYLLPVIQLQSAWALNGERWKLKYGVMAAKNIGYETKFCCVPASVLYQEICRAMVINNKDKT